MPSGDAVDFIYKRYTADDATTWSVKVDKTWGADADAGFANFNAADPMLTKTATNSPRTITLQDPVTGRQTTRVVGSLTADAWTEADWSGTQKFRGLAGAVTVNKIAQRGEHFRRARAIISHAEPSTA